eukprot:jgi/Phyca11/115009/e_gw1.27.94.1
MELKTRTRYNENRYIDASKRGNESRFINHLCDPNCQWIEFQSIDGPRVGAFTLRDIAIGEEITVEYTPHRLPFKCLCRQPRCRDSLS